MSRLTVNEDNTCAAVTGISTAVSRAVEKIGLMAEGYAKAKCPVDTGNLRNSITHQAEGDTAYIGTNVEYAPYVELGTKKQDAQPFLRPAATEHGEQYRQILQNELHD